MVVLRAPSFFYLARKSDFCEIPNCPWAFQQERERERERRVPTTAHAATTVSHFLSFFLSFFSRVSPLELWSVYRYLKCCLHRQE